MIQQGLHTTISHNKLISLSKINMETLMKVFKICMVTTQFHLKVVQLTMIDKDYKPETNSKIQIILLINLVIINQALLGRVVSQIQGHSDSTTMLISQTLTVVPIDQNTQKVMQLAKKTNSVKIAHLRNLKMINTSNFKTYQVNKHMNSSSK